MSPFGEAALAKLELQPGQAILDVGCGAGETLLSLARALGGRGRVVGVDPSRRLLERARERVSALRIAEVIEGDAATYPFESEFDGVFSRFGVMFFSEPVLAFAHLRRALKPEGRLAFVCWQPLDDNPWVFVPLRAAREVIGAAEGEVSPDAPGPFAFARAERVRGILSAAGYCNIDLEPLRAPVCIAEEGIDAGLDFTLRVGPVARLIAEEPEPVRLAVRERIREHLAPLVREGRIELEGAVWVVSARAGSK